MVAQDLRHYLDQRVREIRGASAVPADVQAAEEDGSDGQRGRILARAWLNDEAFVEIHETVVIDNGVPHREKYAYFLCVGNHEVGGYERDPSHDPPVHKHCSEHLEHQRFPAQAISCVDAMGEAWDYISGLASGDDGSQA